jgi:hypothetical protein
MTQKRMYANMVEVRRLNASVYVYKLIKLLIYWGLVNLSQLGAPGVACKNYSFNSVLQRGNGLIFVGYVLPVLLVSSTIKL